MMKAMLLTLLVMSSSYGRAPSDVCQDCEVAMLRRAPSTNVDKDIIKVANSVIDDKAKNTIRRVCLMIGNTRNDRAVTPQGVLKEEIAKFYNISKASSQVEKKTEEFWNKYHNHFICDVGEVGPEGRKKLHITKMALQYDMFNTFYDDFFVLEDSDYKYNVNSVQIVNGKKETVIDYIDSILNNRAVHKYYNVKQIKFFRKLLAKRYGAKKASELI